MHKILYNYIFAGGRPISLTVEELSSLSSKRE
jgi:hypothetical protein